MNPSSTAPEILCLGAVLWDVIGRAPRPISPGADVPGRIIRQPGGVALNIARTLRQHGLAPAVLSAIGRDAEGEELMTACAQLGIDTAFVHRPPDQPTDRYLAIEDSRGLVAAIADAHTLESAGAQILAPLANGRLAAPTAPWTGLIALDGNLSAELLREIAGSPLFAAADLRVAPASPDKATRLLPLFAHPRVTFYLNRAEASQLGAASAATAAEAAHTLLARGARRVLVTDGEHECGDALRGRELLTGVPPAVSVRRVTGAGDTFMAAHIAAEHRGADRRAALDLALAAASAHVAGEIGS